MNTLKKQVLNALKLIDADVQLDYWRERVSSSKGEEKRLALIQYNRAYMVAETKRINGGK